MIKTCEDFVKRVNETGVMAFYGAFIEYFPKLDSEMDPLSWSEDDLKNNPWYWKDRVCECKELAYGNLLGGNKGFLSKDIYNLFYSAYRPKDSLLVLYNDGKISELCRTIYEIIVLEGCISSTAIKAELPPSAKTNPGRVSAALAFLQSAYFISTAGNEQKISKEGVPYGWPGLTYAPSEQWAEGFCDISRVIPREAAIERILAHCSALDSRIDIRRLSAKLFRKNVML